MSCPLSPNLLEQPKSRPRTTPNAGEGVGQPELRFVAGGNANGAGPLEELSGFLQNETYIPATTLPDIYPKELKN